MKHSFCNICSREIARREDSAMQERVGDFGKDVLTVRGTVRISTLITVDGMAGPDDFDLCVECWRGIAVHFTATPQPDRKPSLAEKRAEVLVARGRWLERQAKAFPTAGEERFMPLPTPGPALAAAAFVLAIVLAFYFHQ